MPRTDMIELLLPKESSSRRAEARRWMALMRLMVDDARSSEGGRVAVSLEQASGALELHVTEELRGLLVELLRVFLSVELEQQDRGYWFFPPGGLGVPESCWGALEQYRAERPWLASVPAPNEQALEVAERLQASLEELVPIGDKGRGEVEVWRARLLFARGQFDGAAQHLERELGRADGAGDRILLVGRLVELQLERGAVLRAAATLEEYRDLSLADAGLLELRAITSALMGRRTEALSIRALLQPSARPLPPTVKELKTLSPEWAELFPTAAIEVNDRARPKTESERSQSLADSCALTRGEIGAAFMGVFRPLVDRGSRLQSSEVSPGWRRRVDTWLAAREEFSDSMELLEQELVATARPVVRHRMATRELRGLLGGDDTRALALCPILDERGEVCAWLHLEFEHHLVPSAPSLEALARGWRGKLRTELASWSSGSTAEVADRGEHGQALATRARSEDPRAQFFRAFARELSMKTARRRWWGFVFDQDGPAWMASGGGALVDCTARPGEAHCLSRIQRCGVPIRFDEPDQALSLHAAAGSGLVIPLRISGTTVGCFAVESERRRDFRDDDLLRLKELGARWAPRLQVARFRAWHLEQFGIDLYFDVEGKGFGRRALDFALAGRVSEPVVLSGPAGCGKEVLARWLHFERARGAGVFEVIRGGATPDSEVETSLRDACRAPEGNETEELRTLVVKDVLALSVHSQSLLLRALEDNDKHLRIVVTLAASLEEAASKAQLHPALASRLCRLELFVPPLSDRRGEIIGVVELATRRFAAEFEVPVPTWKDSALGLLWRQPWKGNVRELESLVYKLVLLHPGETLGIEQVRRVARRFKFDLTKKLPSRHPRLADLLDALRLTRKQSGKTNKTRAALYLGWDPDTLVARLRDAGIDPMNEKSSEALDELGGSEDGEGVRKSPPAPPE